MDKLETLLPFIQENWWVLVVALIVVLLIVKIVKTVIKWVLILLVVVGLSVFWVNYVPDDVKDSINVVVEDVKDKGKAEAIKALTTLSNPTYSVDAEGNYKVSNSDGTISLTGVVGENDAKLAVKGITFNVQLDDALNKVIETAKKQQAE